MEGKTSVEVCARSIDKAKMIAERIVEVSEPELVEAIGIYFSDTHALAEGAGAAPLAALLKERARMEGRRVGLIMTGQNIDRPVMLAVLAGQVPISSG